AAPLTKPEGDRTPRGGPSSRARQRRQSSRLGAAPGPVASPTPVGHRTPWGWLVGVGTRPKAAGNRLMMPVGRRSDGADPAGRAHADASDEQQDEHRDQHRDRPPHANPP